MSQQSIDNAMSRMKSNGLKHTKKREDLLLLFAQENRYLSAKQIQNILEPVYPNLSFDTIYRNLHAFEEIGILESTELNQEKVFRMSCMHEGHHHHHFICEECHRTIELEMCPMQFFQQQLAGCELMSHRFELYGRCKECVTNHSENY